MNQGRIWCVVKPTVGLPLFLGSVAVTSLVVHYAILSHTTWMAGYWQGGAKAKAAQTQPVAPATATSKAETPAVTIAPVAGTDGKASSFVLTVTPNSGTAAKAEPVSDRTAPRVNDKLVLAPTSSK